MKKPDIVKVEMSTAIEIMEPVQNLVTDICHQAGFMEEEAYWIALAVREALNNSILHGNQMDNQKRIFLTFELRDDRLLFTIEDEGPGFAKNKIPDPLLPENTLRGSGRGIFYIRKFMDDVDLSCVDKKGARICMMKKIKKAQSGRKRRRRKDD